jgi:hypothetical protein
MVTKAMIGSQIANTRLTISLEAVACGNEEEDTVVMRRRIQW